MMDRIESFSRKVVSLPGALGFGALFALMLGLQGLSPRTFEQLSRARSAGAMLSGGAPKAWLRALESPSPGIDLAQGALFTIIPGWHARVSWLASILAMLTIVWLVWRIIDVRAGRLAAASTTLLFIANPLVASALVNPGATLPVMALMLGTWALAMKRRLRIWHAIALWFVGAAWLLSWPWMLGWCFFLLWNTLRANGKASPPHSPGLLPSSWISGGLLLAPILVPIIAMGLHPGFWGAPLEGWERFFAASFTASGEAASIAGVWQGSGRYPIYTGAWWLAQSSTASMLALGLFGIARQVFARAPGGVKIPNLGATLLFLLAIPWVIPGGHSGAIDSTALLALPLAMGGGPLLAEWIARVRERASGSIAARVVTLGLLASFLPGGVAIATHHPFHASWRAGVTGGVERAVARGELREGERMVPIEALRSLDGKSARVYAAPEIGEILDEYRRANFGDAEFVPSPERATHELIRVPRDTDGAPAHHFIAPTAEQVRIIGPGELPLFLLLEHAEQE